MKRLIQMWFARRSDTTRPDNHPLHEAELKRRADEAEYRYKRLREAVLWSNSSDRWPPDEAGWKRIIAVVREYDEGEVK